MAERVENPILKKKTRLTKKPGVRKLQFNDSESESCDESQCGDDDELDDIDADSSHDSDACIVCGEFGRDKEIWCRCVISSFWSHAECSGWESAVNYTCDLCLKLGQKKLKMTKR
ncbi:hypothetical protein HHI36_006243 [Cryptolaemus montrouzieri]|uniref:PHD-type domain-containing protein n=1 Tax=Cryptolaemus montrouzieri TaxID=559131 RepID=A0ABD2NWJ3_9CUCU